MKYTPKNKDHRSSALLNFLKLKTTLALILGILTPNNHQKWLPHQIIGRGKTVENVHIDPH